MFVLKCLVWQVYCATFYVFYCGDQPSARGRWFHAEVVTEDDKTVDDYGRIRVKFPSEPSRRREHRSEMMRFSVEQ